MYHGFRLHTRENIIFTINSRIIEEHNSNTKSSHKTKIQIRIEQNQIKTNLYNCYQLTAELFHLRYKKSPKF